MVHPSFIKPEIFIEPLISALSETMTKPYRTNQTDFSSAIFQFIFLHVFFTSFLLLLFVLFRCLVVSG